jgi:hypothetical protein
MPRHRLAALVALACLAGFTLASAPVPARIRGPASGCVLYLPAARPGGLDGLSHPASCVRPWP